MRCRNCNGTGYIGSNKICPNCQGCGQIFNLGLENDGLEIEKDDY